MIRVKWEDKNINEIIKKLEKKYLKKSRSPIFFLLASAYRKAQMFNKAEVVLRTGLFYYPKHWAAKALLGEILFEKGDIKEAREQLDIVLEKLPENILVHKLLHKIIKKIGYIGASDNELKFLEKFSEYGSEEPLQTEGTQIQKSEESSDGMGVYPNKETLSVEEKEPKEEVIFLKEKGSVKEPVTFAKKDISIEKGQKVPGKEGYSSQEIVTATLAELYFTQGLLDKAIDIYKKIVLQQPDREEWIKRLNEIETIKKQNEQSIPAQAVETEKQNWQPPLNQGILMAKNKTKVLHELERLLTNLKKVQKTKRL